MGREKERERKVFVENLMELEDDIRLTSWMDSIFVGNWRRAIFEDRSNLGLIGGKVSPVPLIGSLRRKS